MIDDDPFAEAPVAETPAPAPDAAPAPEAATTIPAEEPAADEANDEVTGTGTLVPMVHPDGGTCDLYEEQEGKLMVPALDVPLMVSHGFEVAA